MARNVLVTGASGNLGRALVRKFLAAGDRVIGTFMPEEAIDHQQFGAGFVPSFIDLFNEMETAALIDNLIREYGSIDTAILTVGGFAMGNLASTDSTEIRIQFRLNFESAYHTARPLFSHMMARGKGRIFMIGSRPGLDMKSGTGAVAYSLSKSLVFRLAELLNAEAGNSGVTVSVIVPSIIDTPANRAAMPGADFTKWVQAEEISEVIFFYASGQAAAIREPLIKLYKNA
jgi:NAD(P)-dependent dehydrogenase (short-subunit alcohol dehydrogenase family)